MFKIIVAIAITTFTLYAGEEVKVDSVKMMSISELEKLSNKGQTGYFIDEEEFLKSLVKGKKNKNTNKKIVSNLMNESKIVIDSLEKYKEYLKYITDKKHIKLSFKDLLLATQYLYENNLVNPHFEMIKPLLIEKSKKYDFIDKDYFKEELNSMTTVKIKQIYKDLKGLI